MPQDETKPPFPLLEPFKEVSSFTDPKASFQSKNHRVFKRQPAPREVGEGEVVFSVVAGVRKLHVKLDGTLLSAVLT